MSKSRLEKFLYALYSLDSSDLPTPLSRIEELYKCLVTGEEAPTFEPISRVEKYLMAILGVYDVNELPNPISRVEVLLHKLAIGDDNLDDIKSFPSEHEELLAEIIRNGGVGGNIDIEYVLYTLSTEFNTLYSTAEKPVKSAVLKGDSLANMIQKQDFVSGGDAYNLLFTLDIPVKLNTTYTVYISLKSADYMLDTKERVFRIKKNNSSGEDLIDTVSFQANDTTSSTELKTTIQNVDGEYFHIRIYNLKIEKASLMLIEGDYSSEDIPYFEGMQSVKMHVLTTTGKNLSPVNTYNLPCNYGESTNGKYGSVIVNNIKVKPNTKYVITYDKVEGVPDDASIKIMTLRDKVIDPFAHVNVYTHPNRIREHNALDGAIITTESNAQYITITTGSFNASSDKIIIDNIQLEEYDTPTPYEPYKTNILTINEEVELRGIGDVKDELDLLTGELTQRIGEVALDGSEVWVNGTTKTNTQIFSLATHNSKLANVKLNTLILCDKLKVASSIDEELITLSNTIYIGILKTKASTVDELTSYLSQNPITFQHQLAKELVKTIDISTVNQEGNDTKLSTFNDVTHVALSSEGLIPEAELEVAEKVTEEELL